MNSKPYVVIQTEDLARAIKFISGTPFMVFPNKTNPDKNVYSFKNSPKLQEVLKLVDDAMKEYRYK